MVAWLWEEDERQRVETLAQLQQRNKTGKAMAARCGKSGDTDGGALAGYGSPNPSAIL
jgi:hypothetical protein